jgi:hypothetical protein
VNERVYAIALTAFRESIRDRILFAVLGLGAASVFFGLSLGSLSNNEAVRVLVDHGLLTISLLSNLIAVFLGANFLYKEVELRTLYVLLAKPVQRHEVVVGKYVGILLAVLVFVMFTAALLLSLVTLVAADETATGIQRATENLGIAARLVASRGARLGVLTAIFVGGPALLLVGPVRRRLSLSAVVPILATLLAAVAVIARMVAPDDAAFVLWGCTLTLCEVLITAAFSMLFSSFSTPFVTGLMSVGVFVICRSTWLMQHLPRNVPAAVRAGLEGLVRVVPNLHLFVPERPVLLPERLSDSVARHVAGNFGYAAVWATLLMGIAVATFRKRDLV